MDEEWVHIPEFPGYMVSDQGRVMTPDGYYLTHSPVQYNVPTVGLRKKDDKKTFRRAVPLLVAKAFLPEPENEEFNTPIHLNGNREDARAENLAWRPLWFAIQFHKDRRETQFPDWTSPIVLVETGESFEDIHQPAMKYGLLETSIHTCLWHPTDWAFPHGFHFLYAEDV